MKKKRNAVNTTNQLITTNEPAAPRSRVWLIIVALFALQLAAWITWLVIASHHRVAEVPVTTQRVR